MRLDKFMKISLIFKTRSFCEKLIEDNKVLLNGKTCKCASNVKIGDTITVNTPYKITEYRINELAEKTVSRAKAKELITITKEENID